MIGRTPPRIVPTGPTLGPPPAHTPFRPQGPTNSTPCVSVARESPSVVLNLDQMAAAVSTAINATFNQPTPAASQLRFVRPPVSFAVNLGESGSAVQSPVSSEQNAFIPNPSTAVTNPALTTAPITVNTSSLSHQPIFSVSTSGCYVDPAAAAACNSRGVNNNGTGEQAAPAQMAVLTDVQEAFVQLRIKLEVEQAKAQFFQGIVANGQVPGRDNANAFPKMGNLSSFDVSQTNGLPQPPYVGMRPPPINYIIPDQGLNFANQAFGNQGYQAPPQIPQMQTNNNQQRTVPNPPAVNTGSQWNPNPFSRPPRSRSNSAGSNDSHASSRVAPSHASLSTVSTNSTRKYKLKKPEKFKEAKTPEHFERFIRLFERHLLSYDCDDKSEWVQILDAFLDETPQTVYAQILRDRPTISYEDLVSELRVAFGKPLDARLARHQIHDLSWHPGESLTELATRIRDLHHKAHSQTPYGEREIYAGDTFYRLLPQEWRLRIRDKNLSTLSEYLSMAIECQDRDREKKEVSKAGNVRSTGESQSVAQVFSNAVQGAVGNSNAPQTASGPPKPAANNNTQNASGTEQTGQTNNNSNKPRRPYQRLKRIPVCYTCHVEGHKFWQCPNAPPKENPTQNTQPTVNPAPNLQPPAAAQNNPPPDSRASQSLQSQRGTRLVVPHALSGVRVVNSGDLLVSDALYHQVKVEGVTTQALLDSGSVINIISLPFLLRVARNVGEDELIQRLRALESQFDGYGGRPIPDMKVYLPLKVKCQGSVEVTIFCVVDESDHPEADLLLSPGGMKSLGFRVVSPEQDELMASPTSVLSVSESASSQTRLVARVALSADKPVRIGSLRAVAVSLKAQSNLPAPRDSCQWMFSPSEELAEEGLCMEDSLVKVKDDGQFSLPVINYGSWPVSIRPRELGTLQEVELIPPETQESVGPVNKISPSDSNDHRQSVNEVLKIRDGPGADVVRELCLDHHQTFALSDAELGIASGVEHRVETKDHPPIAHKCRRLPYALRERVDAKMQEDIHAGKLEPSNSPWAAPIVAVKKPDGQVRVCGDYTDLNNITIKDAYPLKHCHDLLDSAGRTKPRFFSTLDLKSGYHQIKMADDSKQKTAIIYHGGLYQWRVMPFGLCNAPATFQRLINEVFQGLSPEQVHSYIDDVLLATNSLEEHLRLLEEIFIRLEKVGLKLHPTKCQFLMERVRYLGFILSADGLHADPEKVRAVREFPIPKTRTNLKSFLGLASYYRRFMSHFAKIAKPLTDCLKGDAKLLTWTVDCQASFKRLKRTLTEAPVLIFPDLHKPFYMETDGSKLGLGAILSQMDDNHNKLRPVAFGSCTLHGAEVRYGSTDLEMLGLIYALKHFKVYVYGAQIHLITDHHSLVDMLKKTQELASDRQERWKQLIRNFDVTVTYRKGAENQAADALSRHPVLRVDKTPALSNQGLTEFDSSWLEQVKNSQRQDLSLQVIIAFKESGTLPPNDEKLARWLGVMDPRFHLIEGILFYVDGSNDLRLRVVVPESERDQLLWDLHYSPLGGHLGMDKTLEKVCRHYYWPKMRQDVLTYLRSCIVCASRSGQGRHFKPPLQPVPVPSEPFLTIAMDIVKLCRTRDGHLYVLVTTDLFSKFVITSAMEDMTAETVVKVFLRDVLPFGAPAHVLTDQGTQFVSDLMRTVCESLQIKQLFTTTFHPQCDGQTERANQTLEAMLSKCSSIRGDDWDRVLPLVVHAYNSSVHASTKDSPYHVLFGREPRLPSSSVFSVAPNYFTLEHDDDFKTMLPFFLQIAWDAAREESEKAKQRQKAQYDKTAVVPPFEIGDKVFVQSKELIRTKLSRRYRGPGVITHLTPTNAVVQLKSGKKVAKRKFHLDKLTRAYPELGDRVFSGDPKQTIQPPSVQLSAGTADSRRGEEKVAAPSNAPGPGSNVPAQQTPRYNLRSQARKLVGVVRLHSVVARNLSSGAINQFLDTKPQILLKFSSEMSRQVVRSESWHPRRTSLPPLRYHPYSYVERFSGQVSRGDSASSRVTLQPHQEPSVARFEEAGFRTVRAQGVSQLQRYQGSSDKIPGRHFIRIPNTKSFQMKEFYDHLPYRIQGQLFKNPFTETEMNLEMLQSNGIPVSRPTVVDNLIFVHTAFRPDFPIQRDLITSRVDLARSLHLLQQAHHPQSYFALSVEYVQDPKYIPWLKEQFGLIPLDAKGRGPWAVTLSVAAPQFAVVTIDLRKVCLPPRGTELFCSLPPELEMFLKNPRNIFVTTNSPSQSQALYNLTGDVLQTTNLHRLAGDTIFAVDLQLLSDEMGIGHSAGLASLMRWTHGRELPTWIKEVVDLPFSSAEGLFSSWSWVDLSPMALEYVAKRVAWLMYIALHIVLRFASVPPPLRPLQQLVEQVFAIPTVGYAGVELAPASAFAWGQSGVKAEQVATTWWNTANRVQFPHFCIWLDGLPTLKAAYAEVSAQLQSSALPSWERMMCLHKFLLCCGTRWRLKYDPQKNEPGATIQTVRRPRDSSVQFASRRHSL